jgi:DoxX-like protein
MQAEASIRLGFIDYFRVEFAWAKLLGAVLLLAPVPARLKEWAYAAFAITLGSALIAPPLDRTRPAEAWGLGGGHALREVELTEASSSKE